MIAMPPKAVIIDLDGTLVDTLDDFVAALNLMLRELRYDPVTRADVEPLVGKGSEHLVAQVLKLRASSAIKTHTLGPGYIQVAALTAYQRHYAKINGQHSSVYPGAFEGVQALHAAGIALACLTNKPTVFARELLRQKALLPYFAHVFGGDSFAEKKPSPLPVLKTCDSLGAAPQQVWMLGDSINDALAGQAANCKTALVRYGYNHDRPISDAPHELLVDSVLEFAGFVL